MGIRKVLKKQEVDATLCCVTEMLKIKGLMI